MITYTMIPDEEVYKVLAELYYKKVRHTRTGRES